MKYTNCTITNHGIGSLVKSLSIAFALRVRNVNIKSSYPLLSYERCLMLYNSFFDNPPPTDFYVSNKDFNYIESKDIQRIYPSKYKCLNSGVVNINLNVYNKENEIAKMLSISECERLIEDLNIKNYKFVKTVPTNKRYYRCEEAQSQIEFFYDLCDCNFLITTEGGVSWMALAMGIPMIIIRRDMKYEDQFKRSKINFCTMVDSPTKVKQEYINYVHSR